MRAVWCGFALGVIVLQQQAALPLRREWLGLCFALIAASGWAIWSFEGLRSFRGLWSLGELGGFRRFRCFRYFRYLRARRGRHTPDSRFALQLDARIASGWCALWLAAACAGFGYAAWRAELRLAVSLPTAWEGRDLEVEGAIRGLPTHDDKGARFLFDVDSVDAPIARFPRTIQLSWIDQKGPLPPLLEPGARWRLTVRLKRPHSNANYGVRDAEAGLLARNVRATGYVSTPATARRLEGYASGLAVSVDSWRAALRARIDAVLAGAPHRGIVVALAVGAQDEVSAADWMLMRATGTSHLVAISGLHIGFVAGLAGWLAGALWRRSCFVGRHWPLRIPAQQVAVTAGVLFAALHAALAGFNVPAQRALWMAGVVALAFVSGRSAGPSWVLAWALGLVLLLDPWTPVSAGFWLSFCAVAAILFAVSGRPRVRDEADPDPEPDTPPAGSPVKRLVERMFAALRARSLALLERMRSAAQVQFAVTVALAPLTVYWFSQIPTQHRRQAMLA